jgi:hypothetical protein
VVGIESLERTTVGQRNERAEIERGGTGVLHGEIWSMENKLGEGRGGEGRGGDENFIK